MDVNRPPRVAAVPTVYRPTSHADVLLSRWLCPHPDDPQWGWHGPRSELVGMYVQQIPESDMSVDLCARFGVRHCQTVEEALTCGGDELAVDAVLLIGEHGDFPVNEYMQRRYPRKELFDQIVAVFEKTGKTAPVFNDKHLSWHFPWAREMCQTARRMGFDLSAGSTIPLCPKGPPIQPLSDFPVDEIVAVFAAGNESYGYHSVEFVQSILETGLHGQPGVEQVTAWQGDAIEQARAEQRWAAELERRALEAASPPKAARQEKGRYETVEGTPAVFQIRYRNGVRVTHINASGRASGWAAAMRHRESGQTQATRAICGSRQNHHAHFATLARLLEDHWFFQRPLSFPIERTLLSTGTIEACMHALAQPGRDLPTPHLDIAYQVSPYAFPAEQQPTG